YTATAPTVLPSTTTGDSEIRFNDRCGRPRDSIVILGSLALSAASSVAFAIQRRTISSATKAKKKLMARRILFFSDIAHSPPRRFQFQVTCLNHDFPAALVLLDHRITPTEIRERPR